MTTFAFRTLLTFALLAGGPALAQTDSPDASLPDASVGQGGADRDNPEGQDSADRTQSSCRSNKDCERGFDCQGGRCTFIGYRKAAGGCAAAPAPALLLAGAALLARARARKISRG